MRNRHHRRLCLLLPIVGFAFSSFGLTTNPAAQAATRNGWQNYQCEYIEPGVGMGTFVVDGTTMLWSDPTNASPASFRLEGVNRSSNGRLATQTIRGPKALKAFVISTETRTDSALNREYPSVLEVISPKTILGGCSPVPFDYSARYVTGVLAGDTLNVRSAPSVQGQVLTLGPVSTVPLTLRV